MPFAGTFSRVKSFSNGGSLLPADLNSIQDDYGNAIVNAHEEAGVNDTGTFRRGKAIIPTTETRANGAFGLLPTPDKVTVTIPNNGLLAIAYMAVWQETVLNTAIASIFIGVNRLKACVGGTPGDNLVQACTGSINQDGLFGTHAVGLRNYLGGQWISQPSPYTGHVTTGQCVGGSDTNFESRDSENGSGGAPSTLTASVSIQSPVCYAFVTTGGTYDVSIQYQCSAGGTITVKDRKLWVWAQDFA